MTMTPRQILDAAYNHGWHDARTTFFSEILRALDTMTAPATSPHRCTVCGGLLEIGQDVQRRGTNSAGTSLFAHTTCPAAPTAAARQDDVADLAAAAAEPQPPAQTPAPADSALAAPVPAAADPDDTRPMVTLPDPQDGTAQDPA